MLEIKTINLGVLVHTRLEKRIKYRVLAHTIDQKFKFYGDK